MTYTFNRCLPEPPLLAGALTLTAVAAPETNTAMMVGAPGELHNAHRMRAGHVSGA